MAIWVYAIFGTNSGIFLNTLYPSLLKHLVHFIKLFIGTHSTVSGDQLH